MGRCGEKEEGQGAGVLYKWNLDKTSPADDKKLNTFYHHFTKTGHDNEVSMGPFSKYSPELYQHGCDSPFPGNFLS